MQAQGSGTIARCLRWGLLGVVCLWWGVACGRGPDDIHVPSSIPIATVPPTPTLHANLADGEATAQILPTLPPIMGNAAAGERSIGDAYIPELGNTGYLVQQYIIRLNLNPATPEVQGTTTIQAISTLDNLGEISLDFIGFQVTAVAADGTPAAFSREGAKLIVRLPFTVAANKSFSLTIAYHGTPVNRASPYLGDKVSRIGINYVNSTHLWAISQPDGARYWFPANDHPRDKATFRFELTVPEGLTAVANGNLIETRGGTMPGIAAANTFIWEHNYPMATYLAVIAVGNYVRLENTSPGGIPLRHYIFPERQTEFITTLDPIIGPALDWMAGYFGPYPFDTFGYVMAEIPKMSMETQTMALLSTNTFNEVTTVHELSHMWFGNWVSLESWADIWRNEGFATYISLMWLTRDNPAQLEASVAGWRVPTSPTQPRLAPPAPADFLGYNSYYASAVLVHDLRLTMGDEAFFAGLRRYFDDYGGGTASQEEFQRVMEQSAGRSLDELFYLWLP
ncbi:MAG: M1 family metallopeptidase [Chloroflexi bacterium]|nr:M1 family metallopeptidase [Chloroflexota bacterium]